MDHRDIALRTLLVLGMAALLASASGCSRAKSILSEAQDAYEGGDPVAAARILDRMATEAPGAREHTRATMLAVQWLTEAAEASDEPDKQRELLGEALRWEPGNSLARAALCRLEFDLEAWDAARSCVAEGKGTLPPDRLERFEEMLADHDRDEAAAAERRRLIASTDPADWRRLRRYHGGSEEAGLADDKLAEASICEELFRFTEPLDIGGSGSLDWGERLGKEEDRNGQVTALTEIRDEAVRLAADIAERRAALEAHAVQPGEEGLRSSLLGAYASLEGPLSRLDRAFAKSVYKVEDRAAAVARFGHDIGSRVRTLKEVRTAAEETCDELREAARNAEEMAE